MQQSNTALSEHLLSTLPICMLGHFTFERRVNEQKRDTTWIDFIHEFNLIGRMPLGWIRADETDNQGNRHIHAAFASYRPIDATLLSDTWNSVNNYKTTSNALIQPYNMALGTSGMDYLCKGNCLSFSGNLPLYSSLTNPAMLRTGERSAYYRMRGLSNPRAGMTINQGINYED